MSSENTPSTVSPNQWHQLITLAGISAIGYFTLAFSLPADNNLNTTKERYRTDYPALFHELEHVSQSFLQENIQKKINTQLRSPQMQANAIRDLLRHELNGLINEIRNKDQKERYTKQEQEEAFDYSHKKILDAISAGEWRTEDSHSMMQYVEKIKPQKRIELLELYYNALNNNQLTQEPETPPPPL